MATVLSPITSCFKKGQAKMDDNSDSANDSEKGKDKPISPEANTQSSRLWAVPSKLYSIGSGAVGLGVGSVKWAASTTYNVGSGVVSATQNVISKVGIPVTKFKEKNKKE